MQRARIGWGLLILLAAALLISTNTYYAAWLLAAVILIPLVSLVFLLLAAGQLDMKLYLPPMLEKGEDTSFYYQLRNGSRIPIARLTFDTGLHNQMTFSSSKRRTVAAVPARGEARSEFAIESPLTGTTSVRTERIRLEDAFGIFAIRRQPLPEEVTVIYPAYRQAEVFLNQPIETLGDGRRWSEEKRGNDVSEIFAVRDYAPGDEVRRIHWKLTEKLDRPVVRDFSLPLNYSVVLLLELARAEEAVMDRALELHVSLSRILMEKGIQHNLAWYDGAEKALCVHELKDYADMEVALARMLASCAYEEDNAALDAYAASVYCDPKNTLLYVGTRPDEERLAELAVRQQVRTIDASRDEPCEVWI